LTSEQIQTDVELQLRKVGIRIDGSADEYLYVNANIREVDAIDVFVYALVVTFNQQVALERDSSISTFPDTWHETYVGIVPNVRGGST